MGGENGHIFLIKISTIRSAFIFLLLKHLEIPVHSTIVVLSYNVLDQKDVIATSEILLCARKEDRWLVVSGKLLATGAAGFEDHNNLPFSKVMNMIRLEKVAS